MAQFGEYSYLSLTFSLVLGLTVPLNYAGEEPFILYWKKLFKWFFNDFKISNRMGKIM